MYDVVIIGGGLAGLTASIHLSNAGLSILLVEKNTYPIHRVCGEYISNETKPYLKSLGVDFSELNPENIDTLIVSSPSGKFLSAPLELGGFGISRHKLDNCLFHLAQRKGCEFILGKSIESVNFEESSYTLKLNDGNSIYSKIVIGSFGKRANLDRIFKRKFFFQPSPYMAVKYHIQYPFPRNKIGLHNFEDGYCGISAVEEGKYCLCYLTTRENLKKAGSIKQLERLVLSKNPFLRDIFQQAQFLFDKPEVINEISFEKKSTFEQGVIMLGDAAGMIAPLCGNGMAMAIHSAKILSETILECKTNQAFTSVNIHNVYQQKWQAEFSNRLFVGKKIQDLFGRPILTEIVIQLLKLTPTLKQFIIKQTHGKPF